MKLRVLACIVLTGVCTFAAELPVRTVVLYKHGVGYFERQGTLGPGESARLDFKAEDMNDVLKSLTVIDQGGKVTGLRYDSAIPLEQKLNGFPFRIENGEALSAVIDQLKGARIEMDFGTQKTAGAIVSARVIPGDKDHAEREQLTLLMDSGELRNVDLAAASAIRFPDAKLQTQFRDYLAELTGARSKDKRSLYIDSSDKTSRDVRATYIAPMPAWKSSYRLLFGEGSQPPTLEGWAIVDNTTGEDWTNIHLSLVSGKPISFVSQLYAPKYVARQGAALPEDAAVAPTLHNGAISAAMAPPPPPPPGAQQKDMAQLYAPSAGLRVGGNAGGVLGGIVGGVPGGSGGGSGGGFGGGVYRAEASNFGQIAAGEELADLFEYNIPSTVTVHKDESAMLPFLQQKISARRLVLYSDSSRPNPLSAAEVTNNTGKTLDGGPITVYDAGSYAGEALVETVKAGDKRFISYGVDLGTRISTNLNSRTDNVRELHVSNGMLTSRAAIVEKKTYSIRNADARAKTLVIEHPVRNGFTLIDTAKPLETASNVYRFEMALPANGAIEFPVTEEHVYDTQNAVSSLTPDALLLYVRNRNVSDAGKQQLQQIADLKTQIANLDSEKRGVTDQITAISNDEERNRQNIMSLGSVSGQQQVVQDYARKLTDQETQISKLRDHATQVDQQRAGLQTQLNTAIAKLNF